MPVTAIIGGQWGDEGKGAIVDRLSAEADIVARYQGGPNAGHTLFIKGQKVVLHQIPSGIMYPDKICILGNGMVIDPLLLVEEIEMLKKIGISVEGRLFISPFAHIIHPMHRIIDQLVEKARGGKIGTTGRGIGPAYAYKAYRLGMRAGEAGYATQKSVVALLRSHAQKSLISKLLYSHPYVPSDSWIYKFGSSLNTIGAYVRDCHAIIHQALEANKLILAEGGQGALLDIDHGTYPHVTSSNTGIGGVINGLGVPPRSITRSIGVLKAYTTRVGEGPFPTELINSSQGEILSRVGQEFGATTGRPRRCGWLDLALAKYACELNGFTEIALTKIDVLSHLGKDFTDLRICDVYFDQCPIPASQVIDHLELARPQYLSLASWTQDLSTAKTIDEFPKAARNYVEFIETFLQTPVTMISVGPERDQIIYSEKKTART